MGLINRLIGNEEPKIRVHSFPKAYDMFERHRITFDELVDGYRLSDFNQPVAQVFPGTDKFGMSIDHQWVDGDAIQARTTGVLPTPLDTETIYFVTESNPPEGTIKLSQQPDGTPIVDIADNGTGTHTFYRIDPDLIFWGKERRRISSNAGLKDEELRKRVWDEMAEGIFELAEQSIAFVDEERAREELSFSADYLDAS